MRPCSSSGRATQWTFQHLATRRCAPLTQSMRTCAPKIICLFCFAHFSCALLSNLLVQAAEKTHSDQGHLQQIGSHCSNCFHFTCVSIVDASKSSHCNPIQERVPERMRDMTWSSLRETHVVITLRHCPRNAPPSMRVKTSYAAVRRSAHLIRGVGLRDRDGFGLFDRFARLSRASCLASGALPRSNGNQAVPFEVVDSCKGGKSSTVFSNAAPLWRTAAITCNHPSTPLRACFQGNFPRATIRASTILAHSLEITPKLPNVP